MPVARRLRRGRPALVGAPLSRRLHLLWLARPAASLLLAVRPRCGGASIRTSRPSPAPCTTTCAGRSLAMTDCWANVMPAGVVHSLHLHPTSFISGTYYVEVPEGRRRPEVRGSAAVAAHGGAAAARRCARKLSLLRRACLPRRAISCCSRAGCATRCRRRASPASASRLASTTPGQPRDAEKPSLRERHMRTFLVFVRSCSLPPAPPRPTRSCRSSTPTCTTATMPGRSCRPSRWSRS